MNKTISENTKVILLLTSYFNNNELRQCKPLTPNGYGYFARWLSTYKYQPADLLQQDKLSTVLAHWLQADSHPVVKQKVALDRLDRTIADITPARIQTLLGRGASLSMALDKWTAAGIWILDRSHQYYPAKIKKALKDQAPAILFGIGNVVLLSPSKPTIGFVGSRDCEECDEDATTQYVNTINQNGFQVVSGAAKGVDSHSMLTSLQNGHTSIGVIADSLFKASVDQQWRNYLKSEQLVLITPFYPEGKFSPANAMQRNKFIYILSQATVVIRSTESSASKKSGTWEGAKENLQKGWVPLMVSEHISPNYPANQALINGQIKKAKLQVQKMLPSLSADDFLVLLNTANQQQVSQRVEAENSQEQLLGGDLFGAEPPVLTTTVTSDFPQRPVSPVGNGYADKDEIDVSAMASLDECKTSKNLASAEVAVKPKVEIVAELALNSAPIDPVIENSNTIESTVAQETIAQTSVKENIEVQKPVIDIAVEQNIVHENIDTATVIGEIVTEHIDTKAVIESDSEERSTETLINESSANENESNINESRNAELSDSQSDKPALSPTMTVFYTQITQLIEVKSNQALTYAELDEAFPELRLISKTALNKWLEYLIEQGYLLRPKPHRKEYCIAS